MISFDPIMDHDYYFKLLLIRGAGRPINYSTLAKALMTKAKVVGQSCDIDVGCGIHPSAPA